MSMIKCKECGKDISNKAKKCVHCGNPIEKISNENEEKKKKTSKILNIIALTFVCFIAFAVTGAIYFEGSKPFSIISLVVFIAGVYGIIQNIKAIRCLSGKVIEKDINSKKKSIKIMIAITMVLVGIIVTTSIIDNNNKEAQRQEIINQIKDFYNKGYISLTGNELKDLEGETQTELEKRLAKINETIKYQQESNEKYSTKLDEIFEKQIKVKLYQGEDTNFVYMPTSLKLAETPPKTKIELVTINKLTGQIDDIYYSVEMYLTVINKYNAKDIAEGTTTRYYKTKNVDEIHEINNYNDKAIQNEITNTIEGKTNKIVVKPSKNNNYKYDFFY